MVQKYMVRKIRRFSGLGCFFWLLYFYVSESNSYRLEGRYTSLGQLLCAMGCDEIENWNFENQSKSPGGHVIITSYSYSKTVGGCELRIEVDVLEKSEIRWGNNETDDQISCSLSPQELHKVLSLLHDTRVLMQNDLGNPEKMIDAVRVVPMMDEVVFLDRLGGKLNDKMRQWHENHPDDP